MKYTSKKIQEILKSPSAYEGLDYIQPIYGEAETALWIMNACGLPLDDIKLWTEELSQQVVPQYSTWSLAYWEELLGLPTDTSKSIKERRKLILAARVTRAPMNPKKVEMILKNIAGCDVTITENTAKNTFSLQFEGDYSPKGKNSAKKKLNEVKPAHLIYWMNLFVHTDFFTKNQLLCPSLKLSFSYTHFIEGYCLDGIRQLDGTWVLSAKRKGILFPYMTITLSTKNRDGYLHEHVLSCQLGNKYTHNQLYLGLKYACVHTNFESGYRLDGRGLLDGTWLLFSTRKSIACHRVTTSYAIQNHNKGSIDVCIAFHFYKNSISSGLTLQHFTQWQYQQRCFLHNTMVFQTGKNNKNHAKASLTMDSMWCLNGTNALNEENRLNAEIKTVVL